MTSPEWFEQRLFEKQGFTSLESWSKAGEEGEEGEESYEDWHPDNLVMLEMWQRSDLGAVLGSESISIPIEEALLNLSTRILLMPCQNDQYLTWQFSEKEAALLKNGELAVIPSIWGHIAGGGANPEDTEWMDRRIASFLGSGL